MNMKKFGCFAVFAVLAVAAVFAYVATSDTNGYENEIDEYIMNFEYDPVSSVAVETKVQQKPVDFSEGNGKTVTIKYELVDIESDPNGVLVNSSQIAMKAYPGALLKGDENLPNGTPNSIIVSDRACATMNIDLPGLSKSTFTVNPRNYGPVKDAITQMCNDCSWTQDMTARITSTFEKAESQEQIKVQLNLSADHLAGLGINAGWTSSGTETTYVVKFTQVYYTVSVSLESLPSKYFGPETTLEEIQNAIKDGHQGVIVDNVVYGRTILASITSSESSDEIDAAIEMAICGTDEDLSDEQKKILKDVKVNFYMYGGPSPKKVPTTLAELKTLVAESGNVSKSDLLTGVPISYSTSFLDSGDTAVCSTSTNYNKKTIIETSEVYYSYHFDGAYVSHSWLTYTTFDRIDENGNYVNLHDVTIDRSGICATSNWSTTITAKHLPEMKMKIHADGNNDCVTDYVVTPLYKLYYDHGGSICAQDLDIYVDDERVYHC